MGLKEHGLEARQGVMLHLLEYSRFQDDHTSPPEVTQPGIASRLNIPRGYISYLLSRMEEDGSAEQTLRHVKGEKRKKKVCFLTEKGSEQANEIFSDLARKNVRFIFRGDAFDLPMSEVVEMTGLQLLDILLRTEPASHQDIERIPWKVLPEERISKAVPFIEPVKSFVGRKREMESAERWLKKDSGPLVIIGLAGEGKTALCFELLRRARSWGTEAIYHKVKGWDPLPYLVSDIAVQLSSIGRNSLPDLLCERGRVPMDVLVNILRSESKDGRLLLALDDVQEIKDHDMRKSILEPLFDLSLNGIGLMVLSRERPGTGDPRSRVLEGKLLELKLKPLSREDVELFVKREGIESPVDIYGLSRGHPLFMRLLGHYSRSGGEEKAVRDIQEFISREVLSGLTERQRNLVDILTIDRLGLEQGKLLELDAQDMVFSREDVNGLLSSSILGEVEGRTDVHDMIGSTNISLISRSRKNRIHRVLGEHYLEEFTKLETRRDCSTDEMVTRSTMLKEMLHHRAATSGPSEMVELISEFGDELVSISENRLLMSMTEGLLKGMDLDPDKFDPRSTARLLILNGWCHSTMGGWDTAMERYLSALKISERNGSENMIGRCRNAIGSIHLMKGDLGGAERSITDAMELLVADLDRSKALSNLAVVKWQLSDLEKAIELIDESLKISRSLGDGIGISRALNNRGIILMQKGDLEDSLATFEEAIDICRHNRYRQTESTIEDNIGEVLARNGEKEKALEHFRASLEIAGNLGFRWQVAEATKNMAMLLEDRDERVAMLIEARNIFSELGAEREIEEVSRLLREQGTVNIENISIDKR